MTIADTAHGRGLLVKIKDLKGEIEAEVDAQTDWLQDCSYDARNDLWVLVDGKKTRLILRSGTDRKKLRTYRRFRSKSRFMKPYPSRSFGCFCIYKNASSA